MTSRSQTGATPGTRVCRCRTIGPLHDDPPRGAPLPVRPRRVSTVASGSPPHAPPPLDWARSHSVGEGGAWAERGAGSSGGRGLGGPIGRLTLATEASPAESRYNSYAPRDRGQGPEKAPAPDPDAAAEGVPGRYRGLTGDWEGLWLGLSCMNVQHHKHAGAIEH